MLCIFNRQTSPWCNWHTGMRLVNPQTIKPGQLHTDCIYLGILVSCCCS